MGDAEPRLNLPQGLLIDHYRVRRYLGHGFECTAYMAEQTGTGILRVLKFYRYRGPQTSVRVLRIARLLHRLTDTGAVAAYHHMGQWLSRTGEAYLYCVVGYLDGPLLTDMLSRRWSEERSYNLLHTLCLKLAAVHARNLAIGDFDDGNNVIIVGANNPVFCDVGFTGRRPFNRDFAGDVAALASISRKLAACCARSARMNSIASELGTATQRHNTRWTTARLLEWLSAN